MSAVFFITLLHQDTQLLFLRVLHISLCVVFVNDIITAAYSIIILVSNFCDLRSKEINTSFSMVNIDYCFKIITDHLWYSLQFFVCFHFILFYSKLNTLKNTAHIFLYVLSSESERVLSFSFGINAVTYKLCQMCAYLVSITTQHYSFLYHKNCFPTTIRCSSYNLFCDSTIDKIPICYHFIVVFSYYCV